MIEFKSLRKAAAIEPGKIVILEQFGGDRNLPCEVVGIVPSPFSPHDATAPRQAVEMISLVDGKKKHVVEKTFNKRARDATPEEIHLALEAFRAPLRQRVNYIKAELAETEHKYAVFLEKTQAFYDTHFGGIRWPAAS
jgi:hypothetical protein